VGRRDRLRARQLPTETIRLPDPAGGADEVFELRGLSPDEWETLVAEHPPSDDESALGAQWDVTTFRPALLAACVLTPEGDEPLTAQDWAELAAGTTFAPGEFTLLFHAALELNDRTPLAGLGKG
jgi:hypothetical protein